MRKTALILSIVFILTGCASAQSKVDYLSPLRPEFFVQPNGNDHWRLAEPFRFQVDGRSWEAPRGMWTDFASVPRFLWAVISPYELGCGPIAHDAGYRHKWESKEYWDKVFLACMERDGIPAWKREAAYYAVVWFGQSAWERPAPPANLSRNKSMPMDGLRRGTAKDIGDQAARWINFVRLQTREVQP